MMAKKKSKPLPFYPSKPYYDAFCWCVKKKIRVYPVIQQDQSYKLVKEIKKEVVFESNNTYSKKEVDAAVWKFYLHIFDSSK